MKDSTSLRHELTEQGAAFRCSEQVCDATSVTRLGDLLDFGPIFKAFGNN